MTTNLIGLSIFRNLEIGGKFFETLNDFEVIIL